jgi:hypothetical protein
MSSQFLSIPDTSHCQPIYTDFVPTMSSTNIPDFAPCLNKESELKITKVCALKVIDSGIILKYFDVLIKY